MIAILTSRYLHHPEQADSCDASHAFLITCIEKSAEADRSTLGQAYRPFLDEIIPSYAQSLLSETLTSHFEPSRLLDVFPKLAAASSPRALDRLLLLLQASDFEDHQTTRLQLEIQIAPHIPTWALRRYLDGVADRITQHTEQSSPERVQLVGAIWTMLQDIGDEAKGKAYEWWSDWRERLEAPSVPRARL